MEKHREIKTKVIEITPRTKRRANLAEIFAGISGFGRSRTSKSSGLPAELRVHKGRPVYVGLLHKLVHVT